MTGRDRCIGIVTALLCMTLVAIVTAVGAPGWFLVVLLPLFVLDGALLSWIYRRLNKGSSSTSQWLVVAFSGSVAATVGGGFLLGFLLVR